MEDTRTALDTLIGMPAQRKYKQKPPRLDTLRAGSVTVDDPNGTPQTLIRHWINSHTPTAQIEEVRALASTILDSDDLAMNWLLRPNAATDNRPPIDLIGEKNGYERVTNLLSRVE